MSLASTGPCSALAAAIDFDPYKAGTDRLIDAWLPVEFATNSMNRSMGLTDLYPFLLSPKVIEKLGYIHALTHPAAKVIRLTAPTAWCS